MSMRTRLPLFVGFLAVLAVGCGDSGKRHVGVTSYQPNLDIPEYAKHDNRPPMTQPKEADIRKTGTGEWNTGRATQPQPKALEKEFVVKGTVSAAGGNSLTVNAEGGGVRTFQADENTQVFRAGDSRFFALPGGVGGLGQGTAVSVLGYSKNGQDFARCVSVGDGGFVVPGGGAKKK